MGRCHSNEPALRKEGEPNQNDYLNPTFSDLGSPQKTDWVVLFHRQGDRHSKYPNVFKFFPIPPLCLSCEALHCSNLDLSNLSRGYKIHNRLINSFGGFLLLLY